MCITYYKRIVGDCSSLPEGLLLSPITINNYVYDTKFFLMYLYNHLPQIVALNTICKQDIAGFLRKHYPNVSKSSRNRRLMTLRNLGPLVSILFIQMAILVVVIICLLYAVSPPYLYLNFVLLVLL